MIFVGCISGRLEITDAVCFTETLASNNQTMSRQADLSFLWYDMTCISIICLSLLFYVLSNAVMPWVSSAIF